MVVLGLACDRGLVEKWRGKPVGFGEQALHGLLIQCFAHDKVAILGERLSLLLCEFHKVHTKSAFICVYQRLVLHSNAASRHSRAAGSSRAGIDRKSTRLNSSHLALS